MSVCEHCGRARTVTMEMQPGADGVSWSLCSRCWIDGVRSMREPRPPDKTIYEAVEPSTGVRHKMWMVPHDAPADTPPPKDGKPAKRRKVKHESA